VLQLVANNYPERMNKVFIMDAPTIFWVLYKVGFFGVLGAGCNGWLEFRVVDSHHAAAAPHIHTLTPLETHIPPQKKAVSPFLDPVTKNKIEFVYTKDVAALKAAQAEASSNPATPAPATPEPAAPARSYFGNVFANVSLPTLSSLSSSAAPGADSPAARFMPYAKFHGVPVDKSELFDRLAQFGWKI
jgi:hypothetical protein